MRTHGSSAMRLICDPLVVIKRWVAIGTVEQLGGGKSCEGEPTGPRMTGNDLKAQRLLRNDSTTDSDSDSDTSSIMEPIIRNTTPKL